MYKKDALFGVEHALNMYADGFVILPSSELYNDRLLTKYKSIINNCHVYIIGFGPKVELINSEQCGKQGKFSFMVNENVIELMIPVPEGFELNYDYDDKSAYLRKENMEDRFYQDTPQLLGWLCQNQNLALQVKYVGQAFGKDGSRNALDRLLKHETLQKIALKGIPAGQAIYLLLLEILPANRLITLFNPNAKNHDDNGKRRHAGLEKLFHTTEAERISLYEAALIRYFYPEYNREFKNSFPSTNLKILEDCYEKDFSAVIAEIAIDELPFMLCSEVVKPMHYHVAKYDLHDSADRKAFFFDEELVR